MFVAEIGEVAYGQQTSGEHGFLLIAAAVIAQAGEKINRPRKSKSQSFRGAMAQGLDTFLKDAIAKKKVPVEITTNRDQADYEITGTAETKAIATNLLIMETGIRAKRPASRSATSKVEVAWPIQSTGGLHSRKAQLRNLRQASQGCNRVMDDGAAHSR
jgi:predicted phage tail protein